VCVLAPPTPAEGASAHIGPENSLGRESRQTTASPVRMGSQLAANRYWVINTIIGTFHFCQENFFLLLMFFLFFTPRTFLVLSGS